MVSIIISSYQDFYLKKFKENISDKIGVEYEIITVLNNRQMGICQAYNMGAKKAKFPYLCFAHEDITFSTVNWAYPLIAKFENDVETGIIGVAGSKYKSLSPSGWVTGNESLDLVHIVNHSKEKKNVFINYLQNDFEEVTCLDGVFLFTKKEIWEKHMFDEETFKGFHCYDIDFSMNVGTNKKLFATNKVLVEHYSMGSYDKSWIQETKLLHEKWQKFLPKGTVDNKTQKEIEWNNKITFLLRMLNFNFPVSQLFFVYFNFGFVKFFSLIKSLEALKVIMFEHSRSIIWSRK